LLDSDGSITSNVLVVARGVAPGKKSKKNRRKVGLI
jgi:hypothetical protein